MSYPANYRDDATDKKSAADALRGSEPRSYITWRLNYSESDFFLTYNSVAFGISHIPLLRLPDGYFQCLDGLEKTRFPSLGDFLATRSYLQAPVSESDSSSANNSGLVQRKRGSGKEYLPRRFVDHCVACRFLGRCKTGER